MTQKCKIFRFFRFYAIFVIIDDAPQVMKGVNLDHNERFRGYDTANWRSGKVLTAN